MNELKTVEDLKTFSEDQAQKEYQEYKAAFMAIEQKLFNVFKVITEQLCTAKSALHKISTDDKDFAKTARIALNKIKEIG